MSRGRLFGSLCGLVLLVNLGRVVFAPLVDELMVAFAIGEATAGLLVSAVWFGSASLRIPTGVLVTRVPRHRLVLGTGVLLTLSAWGVAAVESIAALAGVPPVSLLLVACVLLGSCSGIYLVAAIPLVGELFPEKVGRAMGIHGASGQTAAVLAAPFVTLVLAWAGTWRVAFVVLGAAALAVTLLLAVTSRQADVPRVEEGAHDMLGALRAEWRLVTLGVVLLGITGFVWQGVFNFYELYMQAKGLGGPTAKNMLTVVFAAGLPAWAVSGRLADRLPHLPYVLAIVATFAVVLLVLTVTSGLLALALVSAVLGYVVYSVFPAMDTLLVEAFPDESRAGAYAVYSGAMMFVQAGGASVAGTFREAGYGYDAVFGAGALALLGLVAVLASLRALDRLPA